MNSPNLSQSLNAFRDDAEFGGLDITVVNDLTGTAEHSSEAVEFVCPLRALREFANADITNQELTNQSVVLVNGVRVNLNLQQYAPAGFMFCSNGCFSAENAGLFFGSVACGG